MEVNWVNTLTIIMALWLGFDLVIVALVLWVAIIRQKHGISINLFREAPKPPQKINK